MDEAAKERSSRQHHGGRGESPAIGKSYPGRAGRVGDQIIGFPFEHRQVWAFADRRLHGGGIASPIGLRPRTAHGRSFAAVEDTKLDAAPIRNPAHEAVKRVDLTYQMPLAEAPDRRIARHRPDGVEAMGHQRGRRAHAGGRGRGFAAGVPAADHDHVVPRVHLWRIP